MVVARVVSASVRKWGKEGCAAAGLGFGFEEEEEEEGWCAR